MQRRSIALLVLLSAFIPGRFAAAQVGSSLGGSVVDESGGALPGVTITITNQANGFAVTLVTGDQGNYRAVALQPAPYEVRAELGGFAPVTRQIVLAVGTDATLNFRLGLAAIAETVTVAGETPLVEVNKSQPSSVITGDQIQSLPVLSRNFQVLASLLPGAAPASGITGTPGLTSVVTRFGGVADQRNGFTTLLDGGRVDDAIWGSPVINMGQDAIQEFKVFRNQFDAQYGAALTAVVTVATKSGGNVPSGSAFYFGRDKALNALPANTPAGAATPPFQQARAGGSFGGPLAANRTFMFTAFEHLKVNTASIVNLAPTNPFKALEDGVYPSDTRSDNFDGRIDHRFNNAHSLFVRYAFDDDVVNGAQKPSRLIDGLSLGPNTTNSYTHSHSVVVNENWIQSENRVNTFRVHFLTHTVATVPNSFDLNVVRPSQSWGQSRIAPQYFPRKELTFSDTWYLTTARHNVKIGGDLTVGRYTFQAHFWEHGQFTFNTDAPFNAADPKTWPFSFTIEQPGDRNYNSNEIALYVQDDWRVGDRIRLNLGFRYDLNTNLRDNAFFESLLTNPSYAGIDHFISANRGNDYKAVQPRVGATWDLRGDGTLVGRAGVGMYVTRNRPWFAMTAQDQDVGNPVVIQDPQMLQFYPNITAVLGGKSLDAYLATGGVRAGYVLPNDFKLPRQATATAGIGWQITHAISLDADWVHAHGWDQLGGNDMNLPASGPITAANPRPVPQFSQVASIENYSKSSYDAIETQFRTRIKGGNTVQASYTYSRALLDGVDFFDTKRGTMRTPQQDGYNSTHTPHNLAISTSQSLPWNVQVALIARFLSGVPIGVSTGTDLDGDGYTTGDRPRGLVPEIGYGDLQTQLALINQYRASIGRSLVTLDMLAPHSQKDIDIRLTKSLQLGGTRRMQVFLEAFNVTNFVNPQNGSGNMSLTTFLVSTGVGTPRQIQWGARYLF